MKFISTLFVLIALVTIGSVNAQTASKLSGNSYTVVMKNIEGSNDEIIDQMKFENGQLVSDKYNSSFKSSTVLEKAGAESSNFEVTLKSSSEGSRVYTGVVKGNFIDGTILITDKSGKQETYAFRGMTTQEWNNIQEQKKAAREKK